MASSNPHTMDLFSHPLGITKNGICNHKRHNKTGKKYVSQQFDFQELLGVSHGKNKLNNHPKIMALFSNSLATQKRVS